MFDRPVLPASKCRPAATAATIDPLTVTFHAPVGASVAPSLPAPLPVAIRYALAATIRVSEPRLSSANASVFAAVVSTLLALTLVLS